MARWLAIHPASTAEDDEADDAADRADVPPDFFESNGIEPPQPINAHSDHEAWIAPEIWQDNAHIVRVFGAMQTQWRIGFSGPTGLDYAALPMVVRMMRVPLDCRDDIFMGVRVMESATLGVWADKRRQEDAKRST